MKTIGKKVYRKEGKQGNRLYTEIICQDCGAVTYERKPKKIQEALERGCMNCKGVTTKARLKARREAARHQSECDMALLTAHRSIRDLHKKLKPDKRITHGLSTGETKRTYKIWVGMMQRCYNEKVAAYDLYGGRGVVVCQRWHDPQNFIDDMGIAPDGYSIERNDTHGNYEPLNCQWIPINEQAANKRNCYINRHVKDPDAFAKQKRKMAWNGSLDVDNIPYGHKNGLGWWRDFGLYNNPYIYGPMPWKKTGKEARRKEAIERGWFIPKV